MVHEKKRIAQAKFYNKLSGTVTLQPKVYEEIHFVVYNYCATGYQTRKFLSGKFILPYLIIPLVKVAM